MQARLFLTAADTIAAIATAPGAGGVAVLRVSGPTARAVLTQVFHPAATAFLDYVPWKLTRGKVMDAQGYPLDDALAVFMPGPRTFTGEDVAELHCHGGPALVMAVLEELFRAGARQAERGEFTRRAFLNGRMDLNQAEAVAELIAAPTRQGVRLAVSKLDGLLSQRMATLRDQLENLRARLCVAVDFPDDEVDTLDPNDFVRQVEEVGSAVDLLLAGVERTRCWREGVRVALSGPVNAGKSSLMNALLGRNRAIVTPIPGTTRDFLEESVNLGGLPARLVDTAGLRCCAPLSRECSGKNENSENGENFVGSIESEGIRLGQVQVAQADVVLLLTDGAQGLVPESAHLAPSRVVLVWNKADLARPDKNQHKDWFSRPCAARVEVSAKTGAGIETLAATARTVALAGLEATEPDPNDVAPNARQATALRVAQEALGKLAVDVRGSLPYELCAVRLQEAAEALGEVVGLDSADDVLNRIFESFCIGK